MKKDQFDRAKASSDPGVLVHLVCNEADAIFYSDDPDAMSEAHCTVLTVDTFFGAVCDGGFAAWFDMDHGHLAHLCPEALRRVGLPVYAELAEQALQLHHQEPLPATVSAWGEHLERIRGRHTEEDHSEMYTPFDTEFFALCHECPCAFRTQLFDYIVKHEADFLAVSVPVA